MSRLAELEALAAIVEKLLPLTEARRGELIRAEHWNTLVDCVLRTARAVMDDQPQAVDSHEHPGQVTFEWLDAKLQTMFHRGIAGDPMFATRVQRLEHDHANQSRQLAASDERASDLQSRITRIQQGNTRRDADLRRLIKRVSGLSGSQEDILALRGDLGAIRDQVTKAIELAQALDLDQDGIDLQALRASVKRLNAFQKSFVDEQGIQLDARTINSRLQELQQTTVKLAELEEMIDRRLDARPLLPSSTMEEIDRGVREQVDARVEERFAQAETQFAKTAEIDGLVDRAIAPKLSPTALTSIVANLDPIASIESKMNQRIATALGRFVENDLQGHIKTALSTTRSFSQEQEAVLEERLAASRSAQAADFGATINDLGASLDRIKQEAESALSLASNLDERWTDLNGKAIDFPWLNQSLNTIRDQLTPLQHMVRETSGELSDLRLDPTKPAIPLEEITSQPETLKRLRAFGVRHVGDVAAVSSKKLTLILSGALSESDIRKLKLSATRLVTGSG